MGLGSGGRLIPSGQLGPGVCLRLCLNLCLGLGLCPTLSPGVIVSLSRTRGLARRLQHVPGTAHREDHLRPVGVDLLAQV